MARMTREERLKRRREHAAAIRRRDAEEIVGAHRARFMQKVRQGLPWRDVAVKMFGKSPLRIAVAAKIVAVAIKTNEL